MPAETYPGTRLPELPAVIKKTSQSTSPKKQSTPRRKAANPCPLPGTRTGPRTVVSHTPLVDFMADFAAAFPAAQAALADSGRTGTRKWTETVLTSPLIAMVQDVLGQKRMDHRDLVLYTRRLNRGTLKAWELVVLWCAKKAAVCQNLVTSATERLGRRDFRTVVEGHPYPVIWDECIRIIRNSLSDAMMAPLVQFASQLFTLNPEGACDDAEDESRNVRERALVWVNTPNSSHQFFGSTGADVWFEAALAACPEFWAARARFHLEDDLPSHIRDKMEKNAATVSVEAIRSWVNEVRTEIPWIPGGLTLTTVELLARDRHAAPDAMYDPVVGAMADYLPEGSMFEFINEVFNTTYRPEVADD
jgi:hypothetical protein